VDGRRLLTAGHAADDAGAVLADEQADERGDHEHDLHVFGVVLEEPPPDGSRRPTVVQEARL
jgi:hypothetical protein